MELMRSSPNGQRQLARGTVRAHYSKLSVTFDRDQLQRILLLARAHGISMTEMVRNLVEWGLEALDEDRNVPL